MIEASLERSHSGLVRSLGKRVDSQGSRGFESLPLRQIEFEMNKEERRRESEDIWCPDGYQLRSLVIHELTSFKIEFEMNKEERRGESEDIWCPEGVFKEEKGTFTKPKISRENHSLLTFSHNPLLKSRGLSSFEMSKLIRYEYSFEGKDICIKQR